MSTRPQHPQPQLDDFRSARLIARNSDLFNPPALTNFLGCLQCATDIMAIQHLTFAPFSMGESLIAALTINDRCLRTTALPVEYEWRPDRIERRLVLDNTLALETTTVMGVCAQTVTIALRVTNTSAAPQTARIRIRCGEGVIHSETNWKTPYSPRECPALSLTPWEGAPPPHTLVRNIVASTPRGDGLLFTSRTSAACVVQATVPPPDRIERHWLEFDWQLAPGETRTLYFFVALAADTVTALSALDAWRPDPPAAFTAAERDWTEEIAAVFTPGNTRYSGHAPLLETTDESLRALYYNAIITVVYFKREHPGSGAQARTYTTLMPRYWVTTSFINDWSLTALLLVMLDPVCVRRTLELWLARDVHQHFGTEYASGGNAGNWYSCNDYAMTRLITTYLRVTGDIAWLGTRAGDRTVSEHLDRFASHYRELDRGSGLADYGDRNSLLEAVGTYEHEVASLNAANVWILRELAHLRQHLGDTARAAALRAEAAALIPRIQKLYTRANGAGFWNCRQPDGTLRPVRHAWDFIHTLNFLHADLPPEQIAEMVAFFERELMTPHWMAALSPLDDDTGFSLRPDHQWNGSYPGWVALAAAALAKVNRADLLRAWLPGLALAARQGPFSQAHFVENYAPLSAGGARKAPTEYPYLNDWAILCGGAFFDFIVSDLFGFDPAYGDTAHSPSASAPAIMAIDPDAILHNVPCHGKLLRITTRTRPPSIPAPIH